MHERLPELGLIALRSVQLWDRRVRIDERGRVLCEEHCGRLVPVQVLARGEGGHPIRPPQRPTAPAAADDQRPEGAR